MKNIIRQISISVILLLVFSCNNDFLKEELEPYYWEGPAIVILPGWDAKDYNIYCEDVGNAKFTVVHERKRD